MPGCPVKRSNPGNGWDTLGFTLFSGKSPLVCLTPRFRVELFVFTPVAEYFGSGGYRFTYTLLCDVLITLLYSNVNTFDERGNLLRKVLE